MEVAKWICFSVIILLMVISIVVEIFVPLSFGITTFFSLLPSAIISATAPFKWWMPFLEIVISVICWLIIYYLMYKFFLQKKKNDPSTFDFIENLKTIETTLVEETSNKQGNDRYGTIKVDDKIYRVLPFDNETTILSNQKVKIVDLKGNVCLVRKVDL